MLPIEWMGKKQLFQCHYPKKRLKSKTDLRNETKQAHPNEVSLSSVGRPMGGVPFVSKQNQPEKGRFP